MAAGGPRRQHSLAEPTASRGAGVARRSYALLLVLIGAALLWLGTQLLVAGGSPYYGIAGLMTAGAGVLLWRDDRRGALVYWLMLAGTYVWAVWEVGLDGWALAPRLIGPSVLSLWLLTPFAYSRSSRDPVRMVGAAALGAIAALVALPVAADFALSGARLSAAPATVATPAGAIQDGEWPVWGRDQAGTRFSPLAQINPGNVGWLEVAWTYRTGFQQTGLPAPFEATPLKVGDLLYLCTPSNDVVALDAGTGKVRWRFRARADETRVGFAVCRGVAYHRLANMVPGPCAERIYTATIDARLLAMDARTGQPCPTFGRRGAVDLRDGMGAVDKGYYYVTSAPQIIRGRIVLGGWVSDNQHLGEPAGVIRAFDAVTGEFAWAFDVGRPDQHGRPRPGESYTAGTPNSWAPISADEDLGLVYLPTGNAVPDWYGGKRRPFDDRFSSSVVALDAATGAVRWSFQTTHHDLWDYDVASQPTLYDLPVDGGERIPALIQPTKRGEIFVLDRRTGKPLTRVEERPAPPSDVSGEHAAATQPFSVDMPSFGGPMLTEKMMWGLTPIDQAWCRLAFRTSNYRGTLTPAMVGRPTIVSPGYVGGSDWGGISIDRDRDILIGNSNRIAMRTTLIPRGEADALGIRPIATNVHGNVGGTSAQAGTPFAVRIIPFMSPLGVPCNQPPYGMISAIDMKTRKLLWSHPLGTAHDSGPLGLESHLPFTMGVPNTAGSLVTRSGLTIIGATQDRYLRALDTRTGRLLWQARLPAGGQATPMTYLAGSGRQFVVISAGGNYTLRSKTGDYVVAYALPREETGRNGR